ncbi:MAG: FtsX-like permease family protein, partial [Terracidiphilus sp.]
ARDPNRFQATDFQIVLPGYFETMRTPLLAGRTFTEDDNLPGRTDVIVDESLAGKAFPGQSAIGKHIFIRIRTPEAERVQIIGVVAHQRFNSLAVAGREQIYFTDAFLGSGVIQSWAIRTQADAAQYQKQVRAVIKAVDPQLLVTDMETAESVVYESQASTRFSLLLITVFAVIAATLAGIGLYGVVSTSVRHRTSEIGVRMPLGAERSDILHQIILQGLRLSAVGIAIGLILSLILGRVISAMLVGVKPADFPTFIAITIGFVAISALASWLPARRASIIDPARALREQ